MHSVEYNLALVEAMLDEMEAYLLSEEVFWPLSQATGPNGVPYPRLTLGGLLLAFDELRVQADEMTPEQIAAHNQTEAEFERLRLKHQANLERKAIREMGQRLTLWRAYLGDLEESAQPAEEYPQQVRNRLMLDRLGELAGRSERVEKIAAELRALDRKLQSRFDRGPFVLHPRLRRLYTADRHWYLYGQPRP